MKFGVVAVCLFLGGLPTSRAKLGRQPQSKILTSPNRGKPGAMATNLRDAAAESFLRTRLAAAEQEIARQKQRADSEDKLVNTLASRLDLEEKRMARFIVRMTKLEEKMNNTAANASPLKESKVAANLEPSELPASTVKALEARHAPPDAKIPKNVSNLHSKAIAQDKKAITTNHSPQQSTSGGVVGGEARNVSSGSGKFPIAVKFVHAEVPTKAAKSLETKHQVKQNHSSVAAKGQIPDADTLTAVDAEAVDASEKSYETEFEDEDQDDIGAALAKEVESENSTAKTAVVHLVRNTVPAISSSQEQAPSVKATSIPTLVPRSKSPSKIVPSHAAVPMNNVPPPPPPLEDDDAHKVSKVEATMDELPPAPPAMADANAQDKDVDMDDSQSNDAGDETADVSDSNAEDASAEDELEKDDEAVSAVDEKESEKPPVIKTTADLEQTLGIPSELNNADQEIASEEKELDSEESAVADEETSSGSTSLTSDLDDEAV